MKWGDELFSLPRVDLACYISRMDSSQDPPTASLIVGRAAFLVGRAAVPAIDTRKTTFDGTNPPVVYRRPRTTTYGMKPLISPKLDESESRQFAASAD